MKKGRDAATLRRQSHGPAPPRQPHTATTFIKTGVGGWWRGEGRREREHTSLYAHSPCACTLSLHSASERLRPGRSWHCSLLVGTLLCSHHPGVTWVPTAQGGLEATWGFGLSQHQELRVPCYTEAKGTPNGTNVWSGLSFLKWLQPWAGWGWDKYPLPG